MNVKGNSGSQKEAENDLILIVDDNEADTRLLQRTIIEAGVTNRTTVLHTGKEAIQYLSREGRFEDRRLYPMPRVVFLDLKMPPPDGIAVLQWKESQPELPKILWVVVSILGSPQSINEAYHAGASTFLAKPVGSQDLINLMQAFGVYWTPQ